MRDSTTGFTFFNIHGHQYDYDAAAQSLAVTNGGLVISKELAQALGRPSDAGSVAGTDLHRSNNAADPNRPTC